MQKMPPQAQGRRQPQPQMPQAPARRPGRLPAPVKREVTEGDSSRRSRLKVYTEAEQDDIGIATLLGEYAEKGVNHGHPTYQKVLENPDEVNVFVYFWDTRDGSEFSGWWFGDSVGGQQVWSRSVENGKGKVPPSRGWRVPWDAECVDGLLIVEVVDSMAQPVSNGPAPPKPQPAPQPGPATAPAPLIKPKVQQPDSDQILMAERIKMATDRVGAAESEVEQVIASSRRTLASEELDEGSLLEVDTVLRAQLETVQSEQKTLAKELTEARAARCSSTHLGELAQLMPRLRGSLQKVEGELNKVKTALQKVRQDAALAKQKAEAVEVAAEAEQRDARALQAALPEAMEIVTGAEDAVETVAILAAAMSVDDDADTSEAHQVQAIQDIETSASKASNDLMEARKLVSNRLAETKKYAPEAKKVAQQEFQAMEKRLSEASKRLQPLRKFRQEFEQKAAAKRALQEIQNKLNSAELEIEKAHIMTSSTDTQMEQDDITSTSQLLGPAEDDLKKTTQLIHQRQPAQLDAAAQKELEAMKKRVTEAHEKLKGIREVLKRQEETLQVDGTLLQVHEKIEHAEEAFLATSEAEMPFLKGLEVLPVDEGVQAVAQCEAAIKKCEVALEQARSYIQKVEKESKAKFSKEALSHLMAELQKCRGRGEDTEKKLNAFRKETRQRKAKGMVQEVNGKVVEAENQSQALAEVVKVLQADDLDTVTVDTLKTAFEQSVAAEKEAVRAYNEARTIITTKQKEVKEQTVLSELSKLQKKLAAAHQEMLKSRQVAKGGEALIKGKKVVNEEERKVLSMEQAVEKVEKQMPSEDQEVSKEDLLTMDSQIKAAISAVQSSQRSLEQQSTGPGASAAVKASLNKLMAKVKEASERVEKAKQAGKTQREKATAEVFVKEAEHQVEQVEAALVKVAEAELPFLKGIEVLPLSEASTAIAECEKAAKQVQEALEKAKGFVNTKVLEVQRFAEVASKPCLERLNGLVERNNAAASKLAQFRKDTESHKRTSQMQEAEEMLNAAEAEVEKTKEAGAPLTAEDLSSITSQTGTEICEKIASLEKAANKKVNDALVFLAERRKDVRGTPHEKTLEQFQARLGKIKASLGEAKKQASQQEQRFVSRKLQTEGAELVNEVEREVAKTEEAAGPLLKSSSFLVRGNVQRLSGMVQEVIGKGSSKDKLFKQACGDGEKVTPETFQAFVAWMTESNSESSMGFLEQEVEAMFKHLDADNSGDLTEQEFQDIFTDQFACVQPVSMTENFSISDGKSVIKLDLGVAVEALGMPQYDEQQKLTRLRCRLLEDATKEGWVTMKGNQGKIFLDRLSPHGANQKLFDRMISASSKVVSKAANFLNARRKELTDCSQGPLLEARVKMDEFKVKVNSFQKKLEEVKRKVGEAAKEYEKCEEEQRQARVDAREKRLLDSFSKAIEEKWSTLKAEEERISQVVAPLTDGADMEVLNAPVSILKDGKEMAEKLKEQLADARKSIQQHELPKGITASTATAMRQVISKALQQVDATTKTVNVLVKAVSASALKVADAVMKKAQLALRLDALKREMSLEAIFSEMAKGEDDVSRAELARTLGNLGDLKLSAEQISLMLDRIAGTSEDGVVSRWTFLRKFQQYYECQKNIALTHDLVITNSKPIRMLQAEEVIEVLEGPQGDQKSGIERIRGRVTRDNSVGWVSLSGNQGSVFLKERPKPFVFCLMDLPLEKDFRSTGETPMRLLKTNEVLEILEGPRQDSCEAVMRARCKTLKDQAEGWVTLTSGGQSQAQAGQRFWCCKTGVAVTDGPNIKVCKVLRKLEVGEVVRLLEGPEVDKESGVSRIKALCIKDNLEGWVTTLGNAGTLYAEEKSEIYSVVCDALPLQKAFGELSTGTLRMLQKDEAFEVLEGPKEFKPEPVERMKGRAVADGQVGWVTVTTKRLKRWYPSYICKQSTVLQSTLATGPSPSLVRRVEEGELLEVLDGPKEDKEAGILRIRAKARKDQAVGWITLKGNQGTVFLIQWSRKDEEQLKQKQRSLQEGVLGKE